MPFLPVDGQLAVQLAAVVLAVGENHEDLARLPIVLAGDLERVLQARRRCSSRGTSAGPARSSPDRRRRVSRSRVRYDRIERAAREADQPDAVDVLRLVLEERPDLLGRAREPRRSDVVRAHRRGSIEHDDEVLPLELRDPRRQPRLRARQREHQRAAGDQRQQGDRRLARPRGAPRERAKSRRDRRQAPLAAQVEIADGAGREQDRQDLPPRRELRAEEPHALAGPPRRLGARGGRPQQLHHLLRRSVGLLAELRREPRGQLEVELRVPVVGRRFDRLAEFLFRAAQPAEARFGRFLDDGLLEERARGPEVRRRAAAGAFCARSITSS